MEFDAMTFIDVADELLQGLSRTPTVKSNFDQGKVRASVGRSYYGVFLVAREKLHRLGRLTPTGTYQDHQLIVDALGGVGTELGSKLDRLRAKRNRADYNLNSHGFTLTSGQFWLGIARELTHELRSLR